MLWIILFILLSHCHSFEMRKKHGRVGKDLQGWVGEGKHFLGQGDKDSANIVSNIQKPPPYHPTMSSLADVDLDEEDSMSDHDIPTTVISSSTETNQPIISSSTEASRPIIYFYNKNYIFNIFMATQEPELIHPDDIIDDISPEPSSEPPPPDLAFDSPIHANDDSSQISGALNKVAENFIKDSASLQQSSIESESTTSVPAIDAGLRVDIRIDKEPNIVEKSSESNPDSSDKMIKNILKIVDQKRTPKKVPEAQEESMDDVQSWFEKHLFPSRSNPTNVISSLLPPIMPLVSSKRFSTNSESHESNEDIYHQVRKAVAKVLHPLLMKAVEERLNNSETKNRENRIYQV